MEKDLQLPDAVELIKDILLKNGVPDYIVKQVEAAYWFGFMHGTHRAVESLCYKSALAEDKLLELFDANDPMKNSLKDLSTDPSKDPTKN